MLPKMASEGSAEYAASYRDKLHRAIVVGTVCGVLLSRFCLRSSLLEFVFAAAFVAVELLPAILPFGAGFAWLGSSPRVQRALDMYKLT